MCLDVSENHLEELPSELKGLLALTDLLLTQNLLEVVPDSIGEKRRSAVFVTSCDVSDSRSGEKWTFFETPPDEPWYRSTVCLLS